ncbi:MAG: folate-binding protein YgfZ [Rhizobiales bacterium]|nr:folate-binding protein YgfZ [Hyphomicrobiales bacterium]
MNDQLFLTGLLAGRAALRIDGPEARHFLHNLLTADIDGLKPGGAAYAALLTPQGKILFDFFVLGAGESFLVDCSAAQKADLARRLTFYKLRAKLNIAEASDLQIGVSPHQPPQELRYRDPRTEAMGWRFFAPKAALGEAKNYDAARIGLGLADTDADLGSGEFFPHEANLDQFGGVSFEKGCYVGQEVVSRMEHRGMARSRILPVRLDGAAPPKGSDIRAGGKAMGTLLSSAGSAALALLRLDRLAEATEPLLTEGVSVKVLKPDWVRYDVPKGTA